jgi:hypothetical protein
VKARTSAGEVDLPILYRDGSLLTLLYRVDPTAARALIPDAFEPMIIFGKALVVVAAFEYRDSTIGPYGELGVGIQVKQKGTNPSLATYLRNPRLQEEQAIFVVNLPVTTEAARAGGVEIWGYPKYVTPMKTEFSAKSVRFGLGSELEITMQSGAGLTMKGVPFVTFTQKDGRWLRTIIEVAHSVKFGGASTVKIARLGDGPTTATMEKLGLFALTPWAAQRTDRLRAELPAGKDVGAAAREPAFAG